jgi:hypothetical protein
MSISAGVHILVVVCDIRMVREKGYYNSCKRFQIYFECVSFFTTRLYVLEKWRSKCTKTILKEGKEDREDFRGDWEIIFNNALLAQLKAFSPWRWTEPFWLSSNQKFLTCMDASLEEDTTDSSEVIFISPLSKIPSYHKFSAMQRPKKSNE